MGYHYKKTMPKGLVNNRIRPLQQTLHNKLATSIVDKTLRHRLNTNTKHQIYVIKVLFHCPVQGIEGKCESPLQNYL